MAINRKHYPFPEMVDKGDTQWKIGTSTNILPNVNKKAGVMEVPLDGSVHSRFIRNHEMGHVHWSPNNPGKKAQAAEVDMSVLQAVEDMRVNLKLGDAEIDVSSGAFPKPVVESLAKDVLRRGDLRNVILSAVAAVGCGETETTLKDVFSVTPFGTKAIEVSNMARQMMYSATQEPAFKDTVRVAKWLQLLLDGVTSRPDYSDVKDGKKAKDKDSAEYLEKMLQICKDIGTSRRMTRHVPWGKLKMENPPRGKKVYGYVSSRNQSCEEGCNPRNIHRLLTDGRVFRFKRKAVGGSILVDGSGSMQLRPEDVAKILEASPGCTVAIYSGNTYDGVLRVLAHKGRVVEDKWVAAPAGNANVVDYPSLQWLAKQSKPRLWVCDGQVTGIGDRQSINNTTQCETFIMQQHIKRINNPKDAVDALKKITKK